MVEVIEALGRTGVVPAGEYSAEKTYNFLNLVFASPSTYISRRDNNTGHPVTDPEWWQLSLDGSQSESAAEAARQAARVADDSAAKANAAAKAVLELPVVRTDMAQTLTAEAQAQARGNISALGALPVALTLGADNALTVASPLDTLTAHYRLYAARPGAYRWGVVISDASGTRIEEVESEVIPTQGILHLAFRSGLLGQRYDLALSLTSDAVGAVSVSPWRRESQTGVDTSQGHFEAANTDINKITGDRSFQLVLTTGADVQTRQHPLHIEPLGVIINGGRLYLNAWGVPLCPYAVSPATTYHVVGTFDYTARRVRLYVDGVFAGEDTRTDAEPVYGRHILVGNGSLGSSTRFLGEILLNRNFNYVLSPAEIEVLCNHGNPAGYVLPAAEKRAGRCIAEYLPGNIVPARREDFPKVVFPTSSYTGSSNVFAANHPDNANRYNDQPAANGFSGDYTRFEAVRNVSLYCGYWNNYLRKEAPIRITLEYRSNVPIYQSTDHRIKLGDANEGAPRIVSFDIMGGAYPSGFGNSDTNPDAWLEIRALSIEVSEGVGLKWYDSSKQMPVNGELAPLWGPAGGYDLAANGFPCIACKGEPESAAEIAEVLAQSESSLEARIARLERALVSLTSGRMYIPKLTVRELEVWGANNLILTGEGAPTKAPDRAGQIYIDTQNNAAYRSAGNAAVSDWKNA